MKETQKYSMEDLRPVQNPDDRRAKALILIANELHNIYSVLWEMKEKKH